MKELDLTKYGIKGATVIAHKILPSMVSKVRL